MTDIHRMYKLNKMLMMLSFVILFYRVNANTGTCAEKPGIYSKNDEYNCTVYCTLVLNQTLGNINLK